MLFQYLLALAGIVAAAPTNNPLVVEASTGIYSGVINKTYPNVRAFLSIPYGQSTHGENRFMPPRAVMPSKEHIDATAYPPACPQYVSGVKNIWNQYIPWYLQYWGISNYSAGVSAPFASEDCLKLAIWTPVHATKDLKLPVAMFWTGGGFQTNGILVSGTLPPGWVHRTESHVVVTINYRMNILGFPNAAGLEPQNPGLLDMRVALEWVRDNIEYFGGDPSKIMVWGQSAGGAAVEYHNYAFYDDPIAHAMFAQSGTVAGGGFKPIVEQSNFTFVARSLGCDFPSDAEAELGCMQKLPYDDLINFMGEYQENRTLIDPKLLPISFNPVPDHKTVFQNYTQRYAEDKVSKVPMILSSAANEGGSLTPLPAGGSAPNQTLVDATTIRTTCGATNTSLLRSQAGLKTYRYQYAGEWPNQNPLPWMGAVCVDVVLR